MVLQPTRWFCFVAFALIVNGGWILTVKGQAKVVPQKLRASYKFAEYGNVEFVDEKARLDNYAIELQTNSPATAHIIAYESCAGEAKIRGNRAKDYLVNLRGIAAARIVLLDAGCLAQLTIQLWVVPKGAKPPAVRAVSRCPDCGNRSSQASLNRPVHLTLLYLSNVTQASPAERGARGGLARVASIRKQVSAESPNTLLLFGGGTLNPSAESLFYKGRQMIDVWNAVGLDAAVFGNHDFDFGPDVLTERIKDSHFAWLGANILNKKTGKPFSDYSTFLIREFSGVKVGVFGIAWPETALTSMPGPDLDFKDPCETAKQVIPRMKAAGAQFIIALAHLPINQNKQLVQCSPQINLVIGGTEYVSSESIVGGRPILNTDNNAANLGRVDLYLSPAAKDGFESMEWSTIPITDQTSEDPAVALVVERYLKRLGTDFDTIIGSTSVELDALSAHNCSRETNLGSFIADAFRQATKADVALINGGAIRSDTVYKPGVITKRDVIEILPFQEKLVRFRVTGAVLRQALEHGVSRSAEEPEPESFPQVSGVRFAFDSLRPPGSRLVNVTVNDQPLDDKKLYTLGTSHFVMIGGDGYDMFKGALNEIPSQDLTDSDILLKAISSVKVIAPRLEGRIIRLDQPSGVR